MKPSWLVLMALPSLLGLLNFQNPHAIVVRFLSWQFSVSTAVVIEVSVLLGFILGLTLGTASWRATAPPLPGNRSPNEAQFHRGDTANWA